MTPKKYNLKKDGLEWLWNMRCGTWRLLKTDFEDHSHYDNYARMLSENGINTVITFGCHYRWDFLAEREKLFKTVAAYVEACHKYNIKVIEHDSASFFTSAQTKQYRYQGVALGKCIQADAAKEESVFELYCEGTDYFCPNNPVFQAAYHELFVRRYIDAGIDGLMSDDIQWRTPYSCVCKYCREKFKKESGYKIPPVTDKTFWDNLENPAYRAFIKFRMKSTGDHHVLLRKINEKLSKRLVLLADLANTTGAWNTQTDAGSYDQFIRGCNLGQTEMSLGGWDEYNWLADGCCAKTWSAIVRSHGVPSLNMYYPKSKEGRFFTWALTMTFGHRYWHGTIRRLYPYRTWKEEKTYFEDSFHWEKAHTFLFNQPRSLANIAVLFSTQTRDYYGGSEDNYYTNEWLGWSETLYEKGILFDVLMDLYLTEDELRRYKVLVLPNTACLSEKQARIIRKYVKAGGIVIATYQTSLYDGDGRKLEDFSLRDVLGLHYLDHITEIDIPFRFNDTPEALAMGGGIRDRIAERRPFHGPHALIKACPGTKILAQQLYANAFKNYPFVTLNKFGKGQSLYFSGKLGLSTYLDPIYRKDAPLKTKGWTWTKGGAIEGPTEVIDKRDRNIMQIIHNCVEYLAGSSIPVRLQGAPRGIVFDAYKTQNNSLVLHLLNATGCVFADGTLVGSEHKITYPALKRPFILKIRKDLMKNRCPKLYSPDLEKTHPLHFVEDGPYVNLEIRPEYFKQYSLIVLE